MGVLYKALYSILCLSLSLLAQLFKKGRRRRVVVVVVRECMVVVVVDFLVTICPCPVFAAAVAVENPLTHTHTHITNRLYAGCAAVVHTAAGSLRLSAVASSGFALPPPAPSSLSSLRSSSSSSSLVGRGDCQMWRQLLTISVANFLLPLLSSLQDARVEHVLTDVVEDDDEDDDDGHLRLFTLIVSNI